MPTVEDEGLVPILLEDARKTSRIVELDGWFRFDPNEEENEGREDVFYVDWLRYNMGGKDYKVGKDDD